MAISYLAGNRATGTASDRAGLTTYSSKQWVELGRASLSGNSGTIEVYQDADGNQIDATDYDHIMILAHIIPSSSTHITWTTGSKTAWLNSGSNYNDRRMENGTSSATSSRGENGIISDNTSSGATLVWGHLTNIDGLPKTCIWRAMTNGGDGANNPDNMIDTIGSCGQTDKMHRWKLNCQSSSSQTKFGSGSLMIVLGSKSSGSDTSGAGFFQELADEDVSGSPISATFAKKEWLWINLNLNTNNSTLDSYLEWNDDGSTNAYRRRRMDDNSSDSASSGEYLGLDRGNQSQMTEILLVNRVGYEKLWITTSGTIGSSDASNTLPSRRKTVGKWTAGNSTQIEKLKITKKGSGVDFATGTNIHVKGGT